MCSQMFTWEFCIVPYHGKNSVLLFFMVEQGDDCNTLVLQGVGRFLVKPGWGLRFGVW